MTEVTVEVERPRSFMESWEYYTLSGVVGAPTTYTMTLRTRDDKIIMHILQYLENNNIIPPTTRGI